MRRAVLAALATVGLTVVVLAQQKPNVPVGVDPGGMRVAIVGAGIDYTAPNLAQNLARDGEGTLISADVLSRNFVAYEPPGPRSASAFATALVAVAPSVSLLALRTTDETEASAPASADAILQAMSFPPAMQARLVVVLQSAITAQCAAKGSTADLVDRIAARQRAWLQSMPIQPVPIAIVADCPSPTAGVSRVVVIGLSVERIELITNDTRNAPGVVAGDRGVLHVAHAALTKLDSRRRSTADDLLVILRSLREAATDPQRIKR